MLLRFPEPYDFALSTERFGTFGVDLANLTPEVVAEIRATLLKWKVVFFRDQDLTPAQHIEFGRAFGDVTPAHPTLPAQIPEHRHELYRAHRALARDQVPADVVGVVAFLMGPEAGYVTGQQVVVNGGFVFN